MSDIGGLLGGRSWAFWERREARLHGLPVPGQFRLHGTGTAGLTYTLQSSANLVTRLDRTNVVADSGGLIECLMDMETNAPACFYRLRWP